MRSIITKTMEMSKMVRILKK